MKKLFTLLTFSLILLSSSAFASDSDTTATTKRKVKYSFGGFLDLRLMYDSHDNYTARNGAIYFYPTAPSYDTAGELINQESQLRFSPFASRLNFAISDIEIKNAIAKVYIEGDFMGSSNDYLQMFRMRQAYMDFVWDHSSLLVGQAYNLNFVGEVISGTVDIAGGLPFNPLNRGAQVRFSQALSDNVEIRAAAEVFDQHKSVGPVNSQYNAVWPNFDVQLVYGDEEALYGGITLGGKVFKPRSVDDSGYKTNQTISSFSISGFLKYNLRGYNFKCWSIYGGNLTHLSFIGGYGKVAEDARNGDYSYANIITSSSWFDFETPIYPSLFQFGLFMGYQENLGSTVALDLQKDDDGEYLYGYYRDCELQSYGRVGVRSYYYPIPKLAVGLEYNYNFASWAEEVDQYFHATSLYDLSIDHRMILSLKYTF
ncbi:MAG: hypothetical protein R3Y04_01675 [Rikenellaceae bacterium]